MPVTVLTGARQTGKSTLVRHQAGLGDVDYLTLDAFDVRADAREHPDDLVRRADRLVLDEVQREPELVLAIKRAVDEARRPGRFVLTGSANLLLMKRVSESLAGRAAHVSLWPLTRRELLGHGRAGMWSELLAHPVAAWSGLLSDPGDGGDWRALALAGGYPTPAHELKSAEARALWFRGYVQTYLERDLQDLASIDNLPDFRRVMRALALRTGNLINQAEVGRDTGVSRPTVHRWMNLLETSYQLVRVEPYSVNRTKRLIKSPKVYWGDVGLALHLGGGGPTGAHLENLVLLDLLAWRAAQLDPPEVLYWRTVSGEEVDFVIEDRGKLLAIEVKSGPFRPRDAKHLRSFVAEYGPAVHGALVLHDGPELVRVSDRIVAAPWSRVL